MDFEMIVNALSSTGFPIMMCFVIFYYMKEEVGKLRETVNNNTIVMTKLLERIEMEHE